MNYSQYIVILENVPRDTLKEMQECLNHVCADSNIDMYVSTNHLKRYACVDIDIPSSITNKALTIVNLLNIFGFDVFIKEIKHDN